VWLSEGSINFMLIVNCFIIVLLPYYSSQSYCYGTESAPIP